MLQPGLEGRSTLSQVTVAARRGLRLLERSLFMKRVFANSAARITVRDPHLENVVRAV